MLQIVQFRGLTTTELGNIRTQLKAKFGNKYSVRQEVSPSHVAGTISIRSRKQGGDFYNLNESEVNQLRQFVSMNGLYDVHGGLQDYHWTCFIRGVNYLAKEV